MSILQAFTDWLEGCPLLSDQRLNVNYLGLEPLEYAVIEAPAAPVLARYLDGSSTRQKSMAITAIQDYSPDLLQQLAESGFWERFGDWVEAQDDAEQLPDLGEGRTAVSVAVTASHYLLQNTAQTARYQIQLSLTYDQEAEASGESEE